MTQFKNEALDFLKDIIIILVIVLFIRSFLVMPFQINGQSMYETYYDKEFIIVDRLSYLDIPLLGQARQVERGDVVIFTPEVSEDRKYFIKRVIGLPGETLKIENGRVYLLNQVSNEFDEINEGAYLSEENNKDTTVRGDRGEYIYEVPDGQYFVMGDNRNHSTDGRTCFQSCSIGENYITPKKITGRVLLDLGYFNFSSFSFTQPDLGIDTHPRFFDNGGTHKY
ncbi:signal peptidase I [Candidatus Gracilibacteria bacterium]|nr:signal peptidase I [Candidatus Gracilibacteria bacterium]